jgi:sporulation protein YlmC with PRC-barrel domain
MALPGCAAMRPAEHAAPPPPPPAAEPAPPPSEPLPPEKNTADASADTQPADESSVPPPCTCMDTKPKSKPRPKPKPVRKEAPPQLATAPVVVQTPPGGVINAVVKPMSVSVMSILGKRVTGATGEDLGRVVDVLADASGRVRIAIIDFGGFLGVGNHRIAVDWPLLRFNPDGNDPSLLLSLSPEELKTAPEYKDNPRPQTLMEPEAPMPAVVPATAAAPAEIKK